MIAILKNAYSEALLHGFLTCRPWNGWRTKEVVRRAINIGEASPAHDLEEGISAMLDTKLNIENLLNQSRILANQH